MNEQPEQMTAEQRILAVLNNLASLYRDGDRANGVSITDMAIGAKVSDTEFARVLRGERKLGAAQMLGLPDRARRAVFAIICDANERIEERKEVARDHESRARRYAKLAGDHSALLDEFLIDGVIDSVERERLRQSSLSIEAEGRAGARDGVSATAPTQRQMHAVRGGT